MPHPLVTVRPASPDDLNGIENIDPGYSTDRVYRVQRSELGFWLADEPAIPALHKTYSRPSPQLSDRLIVAAVGTGIAGYGEIQFNPWNDRAEIENLAVSADFRGRGIGRALIQALDKRARHEPSARCLWLETQNLNYPAVRFYRRLGFRLCGLDETLYRLGCPACCPGR
jgi:ribosomal protein S18 acetylase RimI-like enzyme